MVVEVIRNVVMFVVCDRACRAQLLKFWSTCNLSQRRMMQHQLQAADPHGGGVVVVVIRNDVCCL